MKQFLLIVILCALFTGVQAQNALPVLGVVRDADTGEPLEGANVLVRGTFLGTATDRHGMFSLTGLSHGTHTMVITMLGYERMERSIVVPPTSEERMEFSLRPVPIETEQIIVTASRRDQEAREVPVSIAVVTAAALAARNVVTMDDALRYVPGVNMTQDQVNIRGSSGYSRGVGSRVLLMLDGLPFLTGDTGEINWETLPVGEVERVEVVKGAGSALYGSSALGGVINVLTKPLPDEPVFRFRFYGGMYDRPRFAEWDWSGKPRFDSGLLLGYASRSGPLQYLVSAGRSVDESYRENDAYHRWTLFSKLKYDLSESRSLSVLVNVLDRKHGNFFWWKSLREPAVPAEIQRNGSVRSTRGNVSMGFRETVNERLFYDVKAMYFGNFWKDDSAGHVNNVSDSHVMRTDVQVTYGFSETSILTFGVAGNVDAVESNLFGHHQGFGVAVYVQEEWTPTPGFHLTAGARFDGQKASVLAFAGRISPKLGVSLALSPATTVRGSIGTGFRYPSIGELFVSSSTNVSQLVLLPNLRLRPETSLTGEVGIAMRPADFIDVDAAVFWNEFRDLIEPSVKIKKIRASPSDTVETDRPVAEFENLTRARIQGFDLSVKSSWWERRILVEAGYTAMWPEDVGQGLVLKFRPRHILMTSITLDPGVVRLTADYRFISRVDRIDDQLVQLAPIIHGQYRVPIHVLDFRGMASLKVGGIPLRIGAHVRNVMNYHYVELIGNLAPPRTFSISVEGLL